MSQHTPGPWHLSRSYQYVRKNGGAGWPAWNVCEINQSHERARADALLIAAAPELIDALERLIHMAEEDLLPGPNTLAQAHAAIAKARGLD